MKPGSPIIVFTIPLLLVGFFAAFNTESAPITEIELGKKLFFDPILSANKTTSCASCHKPEFAFADTSAFSMGFDGKLTSRNTPSAMNVAGRSFLFWDGRSPSLEHQALQPVINPVEMGMRSTDAIQRLRKSPFYKKAFRNVYHAAPNAELLSKAIAAYERTLETSDAPMDLYIAGDTINTVSSMAIRGRDIFLGKGRCFDCHFSPDYTGDEFKNIGLFNGRNLKDSGRWYVTHKAEDIGKFKVPGLRNVDLTAPYMHNGMFKTLSDVIEYYDDPRKFVPDGKYTDSTITALHLTPSEKQDLLQFLKSLTSISLKR